MRRRAKALILTLTLAGTLVVGPATPANAAVCDELTQPVCTTFGAVCFLLYKLHLSSDPGCMG